MFITIMEKISLYAIPVILLVIVGYAYFVKKVKVYEVFCEGAKEGFTTSIRIIPFLVAMLVAIGIFRASGCIDIMLRVLDPVFQFIGMPGEVLPLAILRPLSGGGASGVMNDLLITYGPDSLIGRIASTMMGSTETTFYVLAVYFGAVSIRKIRHAVVVGLIADVAGLLTAVWVCRLIFG
ncbi:Spore maturation protein B [Fusobacterium sp. DD29]|uniref:spore maturation protein n=1 Tax=unclassified Fusobacterium TaxID=2648384 RepID=UPI001D730C6F|nr:MULTISPECIES: spore maturation protein [unclassified Fusobacterium]MBR8701875.1 Spore maturation protein B [Fusobacterium sp. DD45]MBR8711643.1 Spore maturation protein B [Fusobacterium sp. DD28]MBR8749200.1 Spore maturation protein B [Fusobacterium sp. DD29]MBR8752192.1 Spore maturation protein B [Fusobacterium sp. DD26]MBR8761462.1 Spore maturation protein B [Fusobacterium sp. DD25]